MVNEQRKVDEMYLKLKYNELLKRYYNGCIYIIENPNEFSKYLPNILDFKKQLEKTIMLIEKVHGKVSEDEILNGFIIR